MRGLWAWRQYRHLVRLRPVFVTPDDAIDPSDKIVNDLVDDVVTDAFGTSRYVKRVVRLIDSVHGRQPAEGFNS